MKKNFFLLSFLPALVYWYLEENYPIKIAVSAGVGLALIELTLEKLFLNKIHKISLFNFFLLFGLGLLSFIGDEGIWFKLQPAITGVVIGAVLVLSKFREKGFFEEIISEINADNKPPDWLMKDMEFHSGIFFSIYGIWMFFVAFKLETSTWLFFKTLGFYVCFIVFFIIEFIWIRFKLKKMHQNIMRAELLRKSNLR